MAGLFLGHDLDAANRSLVELADGLRMFVALVAAASVALQLDLEEVECNGEPMTAMTERLAGFVESIISAQQAGDWVTLADTLQYDVEPALAAWSSALTSLEHVASTAAAAVPRAS